MEKVTGKVHYIGDPVRGFSKAGNEWVRQQFVVEYERGNNVVGYIAFEAGSRTASTVQLLKLGDIVEVTYYVSAREWSGKWYNNVEVVSIDMVKALRPEEVAEPAFNPAPAEESNDLPF